MSALGKSTTFDSVCELCSNITMEVLKYYDKECASADKSKKSMLKLFLILDFLRLPV